MLDLTNIPKITEGQKIERPGIYDIPMHLYHSDICTGPSVSSSGIRQFVKECPAFYWGRSYLNPHAFPDDDTNAFAFGRAAHCLIVGGETWDEHYVVSEFPNFRTKAAQEWRDAQIEAGRTVLSQDELTRVTCMARVMEKEPLVQAGILDGKVETSLIWKDKSGIWIKARPDVIALTGLMVDYKTAEDVSIFGCTRALRRYRYDLQAAVALEGQRRVLGHEDTNFGLVFQMKTAPFLVTVVEIDPDTLEAARIEMRHTLDRMAECLESGEWPGYAPAIPSIGLDPEHIKKIMEMGA